MKNGRLYQNHLFRRRRALKISYLDGKQLFLSKSVVQEVQNQLFRWKTAVLSRSGIQEVQSAQNQLFRWKKAVFIKIRCLGGESAQNQLFRWKTDVYQDQVFRRCRVLKISYLDGKQLFISKLRVQEVQSAQNQLFRWKTAVFIKIRCLGGVEESNLLRKFYFYI